MRLSNDALDFREVECVNYVCAFDTYKCDIPTVKKSNSHNRCRMRRVTLANCVAFDNLLGLNCRIRLTNVEYDLINVAFDVK